MEQDRRRVLVAEDQLLNRKLLSVILEKLGYEPVLAVDGGDAVEKAAREDPAIVFMDLQMPNMNGFEAVKKLRELGLLMPVIAVTAGALSDERENCLAAGMDDIMVKPVKRAAIEEMLGKWLRTGGADVPAGARASGGNPAAALAAKDSRSGNARAGNAAVSGPDTSVFNAAEMLDTFMNNEQAALPLLSRFLQRTQRQIEHFPALETAADWETARREAHMIKGAALTMGGLELGRAAAGLEQSCIDAAQRTARDEMNAAYLSLCETFESFKKAAEAFLYSRS